MSIEICGVSKRFGAVQALENVTVTFAENKIYGLLGNNGAGKSTLMNILAGRVAPDSGSVSIDGISGDTDAALSRLFLMSDQDLFPDTMKVHQAFRAARMFYPDFDNTYAETLAERFGLRLKQKIRGLSTGYGSIFRLILGLAANTPYVIFDEPVLGLDAQHRDLFYRLLVEKYAEHPCTVILSTHLISEVANLIEHTVIIHSGVILKDAPTESLTAEAYTVSGPAGMVDAYTAGQSVLAATLLGGLKTVSVQGTPAQPLPAGLELSGVNLQDYFISLMNEEDRK